MSKISRADRLARHAHVEAFTSRMSDRELSALLAEPGPVGHGIGGTTRTMTLAGTPVFVKQIRLSDLERRAEHVRSTANLFALPTHYQYRIGSAGFGAWRELAAHAMTTAWVLRGESESFPLLHHARVLEVAHHIPTPGERVELERQVALWDSSLAVRERLEAIASASANVTLILEAIPHNLHEWLATQLAADDAAIEAACSMVERVSSQVTSFLRARDMVHFDAHFGNLLTDGDQLYLGDFGLASSRQFELSLAEQRFLEDHASYDDCVARTELVNWLVSSLAHVDRSERDAFVRRCAGGARATQVPAWAAAMIDRHAPIAALLNELYRKLRYESRTTRYPVDAIRTARAT